MEFEKYRALVNHLSSSRGQIRVPHLQDTTSGIVAKGRKPDDDLPIGSPSASTAVQVVMSTSGSIIRVIPQQAGQYYQ